MQEHFSSHTLAEIFRDLFVAEQSGVLHLSRGELEKRVYFDRGMILFAESPEADEDLGPRLVGEGKISPGALAEARRNVSETKDLPQALINRDLIGKDALSHTVKFVVERIVRSVFRWEGGTARFREGWLFQDLFEADVVSTVELIQKGVATMVGFESLGRALRDLDAKIGLRKMTPIPIEMLHLSPAHGFILSRLDGSTSFSDLLSILPPADEDDAARFVYGLLVMGVIELDPPIAEGPFRVSSILRDQADHLEIEREQETTITRAYESMSEKNPFELLGVATDANRAEVERGYENAKGVVQREQYLPKIRDRFRNELSFMESRLVEAYLSLIQNRHHEVTARAAEAAAQIRIQGDVSADNLLVRVEMDKTRTKIALEANSKTADAYYSKARQAVREGDFHNAVQYAKLAISYRPDDARYYALLADCQARNPEARWQRLAEQNFVKATELDPWNVENWLSLGRFYKGRGLTLRARKQLEKALEIAPGHEETVSELKELR